MKKILVLFFLLLLAAPGVAMGAPSVFEVFQGGTGWRNIQANTILLGNGGGNLATTTQGVNGQFLSLVGGIPTWAAASVGGATSTNPFIATNFNATSTTKANSFPLASTTLLTTTNAFFNTSATSTTLGGGTVLWNGLDFYGKATTTANGWFSLTDDNTIDVFLVGGQSNAQGHADIADAQANSPIPKAGTAYQYYLGSISKLVDPVGNATYGSAWPAFAIAYYNKTGHRIAIVPSAVGGTTQSGLNAQFFPNGTWDVASTTSNLFSTSVANVNNAMNAFAQAGYHPVFKGILWDQGEADATYIGADLETGIDYASALLNMVNNYRLQFGTTTPFYIFRTGTLAADVTERFPGQSAVRSAQDQFATTTPNLMVFYNAVDFGNRGLLQSDGLHYTQAGYNEMGTLGAQNVVDITNAAQFHEKSDDVTFSGGNVMVGATTTPYSRLTVVGPGTGLEGLFEGVDAASTTRFKVFDDGTFYLPYNNARLAIGTTSPGDANANADDIVINANSNTNSAGGMTILAGSAASANIFLGSQTAFAQGRITYTNSDDRLALFAGNTSRMSLTSSGVGIGTTSPSALFVVTASSNNTGLATFGNPSITINNSNAGDNSFGSLAFRGIDTVGTEFTGAKLSGINTTHTAGATAGAFAILTANAGTLAEKMRVTAAGDVGIGTTTPSAKLEVVNTSAGTTADQLYLTNLSNSTSTAARLSFRTQDKILNTGTTTAAITSILQKNFLTGKGDLAFSTLNSGTLTEAMRIDSSGNVGIGTTTPGSLLSLKGIANFATATSTFYSTGGINLIGGGCFSINGTCVGGGVISSASTTLLTDSNSWSALQNFTYATSTSFGITGSFFPASGVWNATSVGIGTTSPSANAVANNLVVQGVGNTGITIIPSATNNATLAFGSVSSFLLGRIGYNINTNAMRIDTNGTQRIAIDSSGNIGIGTTTPQWPLQVTSASRQQITIGGTDSADNWSLRSIGGQFYLATSSKTTFATSTITSFALDSNGQLYLNNYGDCNGTANALGITSGRVQCDSLVSDARLKKNVEPIEDGLSVINELNPVAFYWNDLSNHNTTDPREQYGFLAQEVMDVIPSAVGNSPDNYFTLDKTAIIPYLVAAVKQLQDDNSSSEHSSSEKVQWAVILLLGIGLFIQQVQIRRLKK